jgi:hypothetical protein
MIRKKPSSYGKQAPVWSNSHKKRLSCGHQTNYQKPSNPACSRDKTSQVLIDDQASADGRSMGLASIASRSVKPARSSPTVAD